MLVIRRKFGQKIYIDGGRIEIELLQSGSNWAKIGITTPRSVPVLRDDLMPDGPSCCCRCGGRLPPAGPGGMRVVASTGCTGEPDQESGRCRAFIFSTLWGDASLPAEREGGAA